VENVLTACRTAIVVLIFFTAIESIENVLTAWITAMVVLILFTVIESIAIPESQLEDF